MEDRDGETVPAPVSEARLLGEEELERSAEAVFFTAVADANTVADAAEEPLGKDVDSPNMVPEELMLADGQDESLGKGEALLEGSALSAADTLILAATVRRGGGENVA